MNDDTARRTDELLEELGRNVQKQMSFLYILKTGIIYGVGFVIGSSILAALAINLSILVFGDVPVFHTLIDIIRMR